jgi:hypothetical protein
MFLGSKRLARVWMVSGLVLAGLLAWQGPAAMAETSYHKLKRRLHKAEHQIGAVLQGPRVRTEAEAMRPELLEAISALEIDVNLCYDPVFFWERARNEGAHHLVRDEPSAPAHQAKEVKERPLKEKR